MLFHSTVFHPSARINNILLILMGSIILFGFYLIPTRWPQLPYLPFEWAGIVVMSFCFGKRSILSAMLFQIVLIAYFVLANELNPKMANHFNANQWQWLLGLNLGQWLGEWLAAWAVGNIAQYWKEVEKPWWTFLVAILGMGIIQGANALWMRAFPIHDATDTWKITLPGVLILSSAVLMLTQILLRIKKGRKNFYQ
jgi:hypothetical protein